MRYNNVGEPWIITFENHRTLGKYNIVEGYIIVYDVL